jgi:uncharacterized membrane protein YdjX (TVP38/TMEM64 family)
MMISLWAAIVVSAMAIYLADPAGFTARSIADFIATFETTAWVVFLSMSMLRGFTLLPSTPLVLAGTLLFPSQPLGVLGISLVGILFSSTMIYFFSEVLGFHQYFEKRDPALVDRLRHRLEHPLGALFVAAWAFFPLVPTDLVCYLAGTVKMNYTRFILAVFAGEAILCTLYVIFGSSLMQYFG